MYAIATKAGDTTLVINLVPDETVKDTDTKGLDTEPYMIRTSSCVLRASSKVFDQMLTIDMKEKAEKRIEIQANSIKDVEDMLYFFCTDRLRTYADAVAIIRLAHCYDARRLFRRCIQRIIKTVTFHNFTAAVDVFKRYGIHFPGMAVPGQKVRVFKSDRECARRTDARSARSPLLILLIQMSENQYAQLQLLIKQWKGLDACDACDEAFEEAADENSAADKMCVLQGLVNVFIASCRQDLHKGHLSAFRTLISEFDTLLQRAQDKKIFQTLIMNAKELQRHLDRLRAKQAAGTYNIYR